MVNYKMYILPCFVYNVYIIHCIITPVFEGVLLNPNSKAIIIHYTILYGAGVHHVLYNMYITHCTRLQVN